MKEGWLSVDNLHGLPFTIQNLRRRAEDRNGHPALDKECGTAVRKIPLDLQGFGDEPDYVRRFIPEDSTTRDHERSKMLPLLPALDAVGVLQKKELPSSMSSQRPSSILLSTSADATWLSPSLCLLRSQIEYFAARSSDLR